MNYFQQFPTINYTLTENVNASLQKITRSIPNMTIRFDASYQVGDYEWYRIQERDRPDTVAAQWYGSTRYTWVVLLSNNIRDLYDWPMTSLEFHDYIARKYESAEGLRDGLQVSQQLTEPNIYQYVWKDPSSQLELIVDASFIPPVGTVQRISFYEYESQLNDKRHDIKRLTPISFTAFVRQFSELMGSF